MDFEHDLITVDEDWQKNTGDAIAAQMREVGFKVKRTVLPGSSFWNDWTKYTFSLTIWNMRGVERDWFCRQGVRREAHSRARPRRCLQAPRDDEGYRKNPPRFWRDHPALMAQGLPSLDKVGENHFAHPTLELNVEQVWLDA